MSVFLAFLSPQNACFINSKQGKKKLKLTVVTVFENLVNWGCKKSHIKAGAAAMYEQMATHGQTKQFVT